MTWWGVCAVEKTSGKVLAYVFESREATERPQSVSNWGPDGSGVKRVRYSWHAGEQEAQRVAKEISDIRL